MLTFSTHNVAYNLLILYISFKGKPQLYVRSFIKTNCVYWNKILNFFVMTFVLMALHCPLQSNKSRAIAVEYNIKYPLCC
jgi:hypothetical protein